MFQPKSDIAKKKTGLQLKLQVCVTQLVVVTSYSAMPCCIPNIPGSTCAQTVLGVLDA